MISILLPWPPSDNALTMNVPKVGRVKTKAYKAWIEKADSWLAQQRREGLVLPGPMTGLVKAECRLNPPTRAKRDIPLNYCKAIFDRMTAWKIYEDDSQVAENNPIWDARNVTPGAVLVTIEPMSKELIAQRGLA